MNKHAVAVGEEGRGDQWGGRAASTRSDNPARTRTESVARRPNRRQLGQTPRREGGEEGGGRRERGEGRSEEAAAVQRSAAPPLRHCGCREINPKQDAAPFEDSTRANSDSIVIFDRETGDDRSERGTWGGGGTQGSLCLHFWPRGRPLWLQSRPLFCGFPSTDVRLSEGGSSEVLCTHSESGAATRRQKATALSPSLSQPNHLCAPDDVISSCMGDLVARWSWSVFLDFSASQIP